MAGSWLYGSRNTVISRRRHCERNDRSQQRSRGRSNGRKTYEHTIRSNKAPLPAQEMFYSFFCFFQVDTAEKAASFSSLISHCDFFCTTEQDHETRLGCAPKASDCADDKLTSTELSTDFFFFIRALLAIYRSCKGDDKEKKL